MANINLLPWREERREELKKEFFVILAMVVAIAAVGIIAWHQAVSGQIAYQSSRNAYLQKQIGELDAQVEEIKELREKREQLIDRMRIIQELQGKRPEIVHVFDDLVRTVPDGVFYRDIQRTGGSLVIKGTAESNNRVSSLMRKLDASEWFSDPNLQGVKANPGFGEQANDFELTVKLATPSQLMDESDENKGK
jgi:type IV pilus assembly protein PilN